MKLSYIGLQKDTNFKEYHLKEDKTLNLITKKHL